MSSLERNGRLPNARFINSDEALEFLTCVPIMSTSYLASCSRLRNVWYQILALALMELFLLLHSGCSLVLKFCRHCPRLGQIIWGTFLDVLVILPEGISFTMYAALNMLLHYE